MSQKVGWRGFFWLNTALLSTVFLLILFFCPETSWRRTRDSDTKQTAAVPVGSADTTTADNSDKPETLELEQHIETPSPRKLVILEDADEADLWLGKGYPSMKQFKLWQLDNHGFQKLLINFFTPWKLLFYPIAALASFVMSWTSNSMLILLLTQSQVFSAEPYNLKPRTIGLFNLAILIGTFIGLATNGPLSDWVCMKATKRNRGIREPEMRLPAMIPYLVIYIIGNFVVAFGYQYKWPWQVGSSQTTLRDIQRLESNLLAFRSLSLLVTVALVSKLLRSQLSSAPTPSTAISQWLECYSSPLQSTRTYGDMDSVSSLPNGARPADLSSLS